MVLALHLCFVWISEQTANFPLFTLTDWFSITKVDSVYCAVRTWVLI